MAQGKTRTVSRRYKTVIGLEVHVQLLTKSKCFCACSVQFGQVPNTQTCPVCLGLPGSLPVLNEEALRLSIKAALALGCKISKFIKFDRKNYYYPDLPKNFQISQFDLPISHDGRLNITSDECEKTIRIKRAHLEEDAGKLIHEENGARSFVDYNRTGTPLLEIVSEPDINSVDETYEYLRRLKGILEYLEVSDCNMEQGSLRCDANISLMPEGADKLGEKVELKNMNSFKFVKMALEYEEKRQNELLEKGERVIQETRLWNEAKGITLSMRSKEEAHDYRYFPEPDLVPFVLDDAYIDKIKKTLPELPAEKTPRFVKNFAIPEYDAGVLTADKYLANYFEDCTKLYDKPKVLSNWIMGELLSHLKSRSIEVKELVLMPSSFVQLLKMIDEGVITGKIAKTVLPIMLDEKKEARDVVKEKGLVQISDTVELKTIVEEVINENPKPAADFRQGKNNALGFLVGQIMKKSRGKANPQIVNSLLKEKLERGEDA